MEPAGVLLGSAGSFRLVVAIRPPLPMTAILPPLPNSPFHAQHDPLGCGRLRASACQPRGPTLPGYVYKYDLSLPLRDMYRLVEVTRERLAQFADSGVYAVSIVGGRVLTRRSRREALWDSPAVTRACGAHVVRCVGCPPRLGTVTWATAIST